MNVTEKRKKKREKERLGKRPASGRENFWLVKVNNSKEIEKEKTMGG